MEEDLKIVGLKSLSQPGVSNSYILKGKNGELLMIDCGFNDSYKCKRTGLKKDIKEMKFKYLIVTHNHWDHIGGAHHLKKDQPDMKIISHEIAGERMKDGTQSEMKTDSKVMKVMLGVSGLFMKTKKNKKLAVDVDYTFSDTKPLDGNVALDLKENWDIELMTTPGHTPCCISIWRPELNEIYVGDLFATRMMGKGPPIDWHPLQWDKKKMMESIHKVLELKPEKIYVSHVKVVVTCDDIKKVLESGEKKKKKKKGEGEEEEEEEEEENEGEK